MVRKGFGDDVLGDVHLLIRGTQDASVALDYLLRSLGTPNRVTESTMHQCAEAWPARTSTHSRNRLVLDRYPLQGRQLRDFGWSDYFAGLRLTRSYGPLPLFAPRIVC